MAFSDELLEAGADVWAAQLEHPFVVELAEGRLDEAAFCHWLEQDYRYLLDYARVAAVAGAKADDEATMTRLLRVAHATLTQELELHRELAAEFGLSPAELETVRKAPTCQAYTDHLVRTAYEGGVAETAAALYPCGRGYLDAADRMAELATGEHRYTPFVETYTSERFREVVAWLRGLVDDCAEAHPGRKPAMREAFLTSARLEHAFWEMAYTRETWEP